LEGLTRPSIHLFVLVIGNVFSKDEDQVSWYRCSKGAFVLVEYDY